MRGVPLIVSCLLALGACDSDGSDGASDTEAGASSGTDGSADAGESDDPSGPNSTSGASETTDPSAPGETSDGETGVDPTDDPTTDSETGGETSDGETSAGDTTTGGMEEPQLPPGDVESLIAWLEGGEYTDWEAESGIHESTGPHFGNVRTFFNNVLFDSFEDGNGVHPIGAANVKELYGPGNSIRGWAVMIKRQEDAGQWYWFEVWDAEVLADTVAWDVCENCHGDGTDNVLTPWPLQ